MRSTTFLPTRKLNSLIQQQQQSNRLAEVEKEATDESRGDQRESKVRDRRCGGRGKLINDNGRRRKSYYY
jgi:hypothetical protein